MTCWIFDLDGVVTHLQEKKITNPRLLPFFAEFLKKEDVFTINTGRSLSFIREEVLTPLVEHLKDHNLPEELCKNFFAVGEKGNAWIEDEKEYFDMSTAAPEDFVQKVRLLVEKDFSETMFFDTTKKTMVSLEMNTGLNPNEFAPARDKLIPILEGLLKAHDLEKAYKLDPNVTSIDVEPTTAGKAKGIERILAWLEKKEMKPEKYIAFGDSAADLGMGEALQKAGKDFTFIFVGNPEILLSKPSFPITFTKEKYDKGVVEYLENL